VATGITRPFSVNLRKSRSRRPPRPHLLRSSVHPSSKNGTAIGSVAGWRKLFGPPLDGLAVVGRQLPRRYRMGQAPPTMIEGDAARSGR
jgi:hypothetical protein